MDLSKIARNIVQGREGIWHACSTSPVSYPETANQDCFAVEDRSFWFQHRNQCILQVARLYPPPGTFFDVGGGNGYVARALQEAGWRVVLVEPGLAGAHNARQRGIRHVVHSTLEDAGFEPETLGAVGLFDVVEHVPDDRQLLSQIHAFLEPGGRVYITVPAFGWLWSHEDVEAGHYRRYRLSELTRVVEDAGFRAEFGSYFFSFLPLPILGLRAVPFRLGLAPKRSSGERIRSDHELGRGLAGRGIAWLMHREVERLAAGKPAAFGGSCLVVARKPLR